jgi:hypothetical protein
MADFDRFGTPDVEQGMENSPTWAPETAHSSESIESGSTQEIDDHGFGTIVCSVARADVVGQYGISSRSCASLEIGSGLDADAMGDERRSYILGSSCNSIGLFMRLRSQSVVDMDRGDFESSGTSQSQQCERVGPSRYCTGERTTGWRKTAALDERREKRGLETVDETSRSGDGSALVVTAALTPAGIAIGGDLLQVSTAESGNGQKADNRQHDPDPPVPHIRRKHDYSVAV